MFTAESPFVAAIAQSRNLREEELRLSGRTPTAADLLFGDPSKLAQVANCAFWAGLEVEEARLVTGTIAVVSPVDATTALTLKNPVPLGIPAVAKLTTAARGSNIAVDLRGSGPEIWGVYGGTLADEFGVIPLAKIRMVRPGTLVGSSRDRVVAVFQHGVVKFPAEIPLDGTTWRTLVPRGFRRHLYAVVRSMVSHGHGGILVVVSSGAIRRWATEIDIKYALGGTSGDESATAAIHSFEKSVEPLRESLRGPGRPGGSSRMPYERMKLHLREADVSGRLVSDLLERIGGFSALDGAVVLDEMFRLRGFGARLVAPPSPHLPRVLDVLSGDAPAEHRGMRHRSACDFVASARGDALALVASQDGGLTLFVWSVEHERVLEIQNWQHVVWENDSS